YGRGYGGPKPGSCSLKVEGDNITLSPPDARAAAEEQRIRKLMENGQIPAKDRQALYKQYAQIQGRTSSNLQTAVTISLRALKRDTDGDGLTDVTEERFGLDPSRADMN